MIDCQVRTNTVTNHSVLKAMHSVPREEFVPNDLRGLAYIDEDLSLAGIGGEGRYLMESAPFAQLLQLADIEKDNLVLDVGCGSGYSTAVLSHLCTSVVAIEENPELAEFAISKLNELEILNVAVVNDPLTDGYTKEAPYDVIFIGGAVDVLPEVIIRQLKDSGRLVLVEGVGNAAVAKLYIREGDNISHRLAFNCAIPRLPGFKAKPEFVF